MSESNIESTLDNTADHSLRVRQLEQQLRESKQLQYSLLDGSIEGVLIHRNWKALYLNKSLLNMLGEVMQTSAAPNRFITNATS